MLGQIARRVVMKAPVAMRAPVASRGFTHTTWVSGMPRNRVPLAEKVAHGLVLAVMIWVGPCYILFNLDGYRGKNSRAYKAAHPEEE